MGDTAAQTSPFLFFSEEGRTLCKSIAQKYLPFDPHDYSIDVAAKILDGSDVLVRTACAGGKTGTVALLAVLLKELEEDRTLAPRFEVWYDENPIILFVCPTNALELNIVSAVDASGELEPYLDV